MASRIMKGVMMIDDSMLLAGSGHALGGSASGTACSLSPEDDPVGSFKIRP